VAEEAGIALAYEPYPAPQPLEVLWRRKDLGAAFMCGYPIALGLAEVQPLASPIPAAPWAGGQALYRSDFVVRADSRFRTLEDTFGGTIGWTVDHSHSGFNAPRHHLLARRRADGASLYRSSLGGLVTARGIVDAVIDGRIDVGPLDAYWHLLLKRHRPDLADQLRVVAATDLAPLPALVASPGLSAGEVEALREALTGAAQHPWFASLGEVLCLEGFAPVTRDTFAVTRVWAAEAEAAGYREPG
jgi:ABC-type phosphate/phosphonate transport system substrate-binding protein